MALLIEAVELVVNSATNPTFAVSFGVGPNADPRQSIELSEG